MKKAVMIFLSLLLTACLCGALSSCGNGPEEQPNTKSVYKVTFFDNYVGGRETVQEVLPGEKARIPASPSRQGYSFAGWFADYDGDTPFNSEQAINADTEVFAHWTKTANVITFKYNDGTPGQTVLVADGTRVEQPADPVSDVYTFLGWFTDAAYTKPFNFSTPVNAPMTIYAGWSKSSAKLTFNLNYTGAPEAVTVNAPVEQPITVPEDLDLTRARYAFDGWYTKSFPSETDAPYDLSQGIENDMTLYAKWTRTHYAVTFDPNERGMEKVTVDVPVDAPAAQIPAIEREGYTLDAVWYEDAALTKAVDLTKVADDMTVYAKWNINSYAVTFDLNYENAAAAPAAQSIEYRGKLARPANPEREGYLFTGWYTTAQTTEAFNFEDDLIVADRVLYAGWLEQVDVGGTIKVSFNYNAPGLGMSGNYREIEIDKGEALGAARMPADPSLGSGQLFRGWFTDPACTKSYDAESVLLEDTTIYARILVGTVFEAELVNLAGKHGVGSSVELAEEAMIFDFTKIGQGKGEGDEWVSNDYYVAGMYYKGAYIEFEIIASKEVKDAVLEMRVSSEFRKLMYNPLTPETYRIDINPVVDENGDVGEESNFLYELPLRLPDPNTEKENDPDGEKTPFADVIISYKFHLQEGKNVVRFTTNNTYNYGAGTFQANAPMIDCITIYVESDIALEMIEYPQFLEKRNAQ
ncbi:MAG: InlB B-repeat-containing protein [Lachnospiraceae bacterium]|nr:InlB B-repeat-containing protein [Lachnospiraceae bacterium]